MHRTIGLLVLTSSLLFLGESDGCAALRRGVAPGSRAAGDAGRRIPAQTSATQPLARRESFHKTISKTIGYDFIVQLPRDYDRATRDKKFPLIIFLHGSGECGHDLSKVANHGLPKLAAQLPDFPFILIAPQLPTYSEWWSNESLDALLDHALAAYNVDADRVY